MDAIVDTKCSCCELAVGQSTALHKDTETLMNNLYGNRNTIPYLKACHDAII